MGGAAGTIAATVCYPLDTIRRRMQMKGVMYSSQVGGWGEGGAGNAGVQKGALARRGWVARPRSRGTLCSWQAGTQAARFV